MPLKKATGNMYPWITDLWNPVKGECPYHCSYCYMSRMMKRYGKKQAPLHFDEKELRTNLGTGNFIFVCSGCDLFHPDVPDEWILKVINYTYTGPGNEYLWHTKNPSRVVKLWDDGHFSTLGTYLCVTIESNWNYPEISRAPSSLNRIKELQRWTGYGKMITVEPILDFDTEEFIRMILSCRPDQVNIGADSGNTHLPEPSPEKIGVLIEALRPYTKVYLKDNLKRLYTETA
jgi:protein gp37